MRSATILALGLVSFGLLVGACTQNFDFFSTSQGTGGTTTGTASSSGATSSGATSSGATSSGTTSSSTTSSSSSSSGSVGCTTSVDCDDANPCTTDTCDAQTRVCAHAPVTAGTGCGTDGQVCDSDGHCVGCLQDTDCTSDNCVDGTCGLAKDGHSCNSGSQCENGHCRNGVCCHTPCTGTCMACTAALTGQQSDGTCGSILVNTTAPGGQCPVTTTCGNTGKCNGNGGCQQASAITPCGTATCSNGSGTATPTSTCDGAGTCNPATPVSCAGYACTGVICGSACNAGTQSGCLAGFYCAGSGAGGTCQPKLAAGAPCTDDFQCLKGMCLAADGGAGDGGASMVCN